MTTAAPTDPNAVIETARSLRPLIESLRDEMEAQRRMPKQLVQAMAEAQLFRLLVPRSIGGLEIDPVTFTRMVEELSAIDGSAGWNFMIGSSAGIFAGFADEAVARAAFATPSDFAAGAIAPTGRAVAEDGGYRVTGKWGFGSGIHNASWVGGNCFVFDGEQLRMEGDGRPTMRMALVPVADVRIHDVWYVSGLRGTGSDDFSMSDLFVPKERMILPFGEPTQQGPLYRMPVAFFAAIVAAVPLGIARAAIDAFVQLAKNKVPMRFGAQTPLRERPRAQAAVGRAEALLGSARAYLYEGLDDMWRTAQAGDEITQDQRAKLRLASCQAGASAAEAVDLMYGAGGSSSIFERSLLQRCFRDVHAATQHVGVAPDGLEEVGALRLGLPTQSPFL